MDRVQKMKQQKQYEKYVKTKTPVHNVWLNMIKAFFTGGMICFIGQVIYHYCELQNLSKDDCSSWTSMLLILMSVHFNRNESLSAFGKVGWSRRARANHRFC